MMIKIEKFLKEREENGNLRILSPASWRGDGKICLDNKEYFDFSSNDYLGLSNHPKLKEAATRAIEEFGLGSSASRLLSGSLDLHHRLEEKIALFKNKEAALFFNSGYQANVGIISSLYGKGDVIFSDRLNHASIIDGIFLSGAKLIRFQHNDMNHLKELLGMRRNNFTNALIITESVFSMDGDRALLKEIARLKEEYDCAMFVDEAHATGVFGQNGSGLVEADDLSEKVDFVMGTFSKALGSFGAYLACSKKIKDYLINICRSFIYSTALPAHLAAVNIAAIDLVGEEPRRRVLLLKQADYFRQALVKKGFNIGGTSQIIPLITGDSLSARNFSVSLKEKGFWVQPIRPPTVPPNQARLRFSLNYFHSQEILDKLLCVIETVL